MLESLRKSAGSWIVKAFLGLLVLSFAVWGIGPTFRIRPDTAVAKVGSISISQPQFTRAFNRQLQQLQRQLGSRIDAEQAVQFGLAQRTLDTLVTQALYDQEVGDLGLIVGDETLRKEIAANKAFHDELGSFSKARFEMVLQQNGFSEQTYSNQRRLELSRQELFDALTAGGHAPKKLVELLYRYQKQARVVEVIRLPYSQFAVPAAADDETLAAYHKEHATRYTAPELRALTYVTIKPADLAGDIVVDPADVKAAYEARLAEFTVPETREVEQIVVSDEALAKKIADRLSEGGDFHAVAKELANQEAKDLALGAVHRGDLPAEVEDTVFALAKDVPSQPVKSAFGWHVLRVTGITPGRQQGFDEVKQKIEDGLKLERANDALYDLSNRIEDAFAGGGDLKAVAESFRLALHTVPAVSAAGTDIEGKRIEGLPEFRDFLETAFQIDAGAQPSLHESDAGVFFLVRVDSVTAPTLRPLADVRDKVLADWQADQQRQAAEKKAKALAERVRAGEAPAGVAELNGFASQTSAPLTRTEIGAKAGLGRATAEAVFDLKRGDVTVGVNPADDSAVVVRLAEIREVDPGKYPDEVKKLDENLQASLAGDAVEQFKKALEASHAVEINQRVVDSLFAQPTGLR